MDRSTALDAIIAGDIYFETIINKRHEISLNNPGGSALYCAAAFNFWGNQPGILSKISEDRPQKWMQPFMAAGCDFEGVKKIQGSFEQNRFYAITDDCQVVDHNPQKFFFENNQPLPKFLLGYETPKSPNGFNRNILPSSITPEDIPANYLYISSLLLAPTDLYSCNMVPPYYRSKTGGNVILCGSSAYMQPAFWYEFPSLVRGIDVFITTVHQTERLFLGKSKSMWEMIEFIAAAGVELVLVFNQWGDHYLYHTPFNTKYRIPAYQTDCIDPIGGYEAFCGGFSSGYISHFDPIESALMGSVTTSIKLEGSGPLYILQGLQELAKARIASLREHVSVS